MKQIKNNNSNIFEEYNKLFPTNFSSNTLNKDIVERHFITKYKTPPSVLSISKYYLGSNDKLLSFFKYLEKQGCFHLDNRYYFIDDRRIIGGLSVSCAKQEEILPFLITIHIPQEDVFIEYASGFQSALVIMASSQKICKKFLDKNGHMFLEDIQPKIKSKPTINILVQGDGSLEMCSKEINAPVIDIDLHYPEEFKEIHEKIVNNLSCQNNGLYLLSGPPGTGKTNYIKNLTTYVNKPFVFIPPAFIDALASPQLLKTLLKHPKSIFVIEDAEKALLDRQNNANAHLVSSILNLSDGFMADILESSLILTFNCNEEDIDPAILRKGRLKVFHKFNALNETKSTALLKSIGVDKIAKEPMTLADIYNFKHDTGYIKPEGEGVVGF